MTDEQQKNMQHFDGDNMLLTITIAALSGLIVGGVSTAAIVHKRLQQQNTTPPISVNAKPVLVFRLDSSDIPSLITSHNPTPQMKSGIA